MPDYFPVLRIMKKFLTVCMLSICLQPLFGQNKPPQIQIVQGSVDAAAQKVTLTYNLSDAENHPCKIWLKYSRDGGSFYDSIPAGKLSANAGAGITPGSNKVLIWDYSGVSGNIYNVKLKLCASDMQPVSVQDMVQQVDSNRLRRSLRALQGVRHLATAPALVLALRDSLEALFNYYGFETEKQTFSFSSMTGENITGRKAGLGDEAPTIYVDAHYDGVAGSPAADDNGSGLVGMLETARILRNYQFEHSLRFIGFDFEEAGLIGSQRYAQSFIKSYEKLEGVLNLEMIGFYSDKKNSQTVPSGFNLLFPQAYQKLVADTFKGNFIVVCGNTHSASLISAFMNAATTFVPQLKLLSVELPANGQIAPDFRRSDHASFWDNGNKALMMTDGSNFRNPNYHKAGDSIGTLNFRFMSNVVKATLATAAVASKPISGNYALLDLATLSVGHPHHDEAVPVLELYPNPSDGKVTIVSVMPQPAEMRIEVYDLSGKLHYSEVRAFKNGRQEQPLDVSHLPAGNYLINFLSGEYSSSHSLVID